jgi:hypothetical protein
MDDGTLIRLARIISDQQMENETLRERLKAIQTANRKLSDDLSNKTAELDTLRGKKGTTNA